MNGGWVRSILAADCRVLADIDALAATHLQSSNLRRLASHPAVEGAVRRGGRDGGTDPFRHGGTGPFRRRTRIPACLGRLGFTLPRRGIVCPRSFVYAPDDFPPIGNPSGPARIDLQMSYVDAVKSHRPLQFLNITPWGFTKAAHASSDRLYPYSSSDEEDQVAEEISVDEMPANARDRGTLQGGSFGGGAIVHGTGSTSSD